MLQAGAFLSHPKAAAHHPGWGGCPRSDTWSTTLPNPQTGAASAAGQQCASDPNGAAITWQVDIYRRVALRLRQAPVLAAAAVLQDIFNGGWAAT